MRAVFLALALVVAMPARAAPPAEPALAVGDPAPHFVLKVSNPEVAGREMFSLRTLVGPEASPARTVVLSFAASYCAPCRRELAALKDARARLEAAGVLLAVVVVDTDTEGIERMRALTLDELRLPFPVLLDRFGLVGRRYQATSLPLSVVIGPDGRVRWLRAGYAEGALEALLAEVGKG
jgi:cytochrome c biogenesis protein CcmG/thiol:disulfide interchange protein DsbE